MFIAYTAVEIIQPVITKTSPTLVESEENRLVEINQVPRGISIRINDLHFSRCWLITERFLPNCLPKVIHAANELNN